MYSYLNIPLLSKDNRMWTEKKNLRVFKMSSMVIIFNSCINIKFSDILSLQLVNKNFQDFILESEFFR